MGLFEMSYIFNSTIMEVLQKLFNTKNLYRVQFKIIFGQIAF